MVSPEGMASHEPDGDGAPLTPRTRIMITMVVVVVVVVLMVTVIIIFEVGDVFVNCDRRFGRWWTRRFLPVGQWASVWDRGRGEPSSNRRVV